MRIMRLENDHVSVRIRLAIMWAVIMFFYVYNDVFMLLQNVRGGTIPSGSRPSEIKMLAYALIITPAALMPLLCLILPPSANRLVNIALGAIYFAIIVWTLIPSDTAWFYRFIGAVENLVTLGVMWTAWRWPRRIQEAVA